MDHEVFAQLSRRLAIEAGEDIMRIYASADLGVETKADDSPVTLADIKADDRFADFALVRQSRLSVVPVSDDHWKMLCEMGGVKP